MASLGFVSPGIFVGDWNFKDESNGTTDPTGWNDDGTGIHTIQASYKGHKKVWKFHDPGLSRYYGYRTLTSSQSYGTVECYVLGNDVTSGFALRLQSDSDPDDDMEAGISFENDKWYYGSGAADAWTEIVGPTPSDDTWHHISIRWRATGAGAYQGLSEGDYKVYIDGVEYGDYSLTTDTAITHVFFRTDQADTIDAYVDAIGFADFASDPPGTYSIGDNLTFEVLSINASNALKCEITHEIMNYPIAHVVLEESEEILQGHYFQVTDTYSVDGASASNIIFEGQVSMKMDNYPFATIWENRAVEAGNFDKPGLKCTGTHSGDSDDVMESIRSDLCDYIVKGTHSAGTAMGDRTYAGDKDVFAAWRNLALFQGWIWYYKEPVSGTSIKLDFNAGDTNTGVSFTQASNIWDFKAGRARQYYTKVIVQGETGSTAGTAQSSTAITSIYGINPFTHRDATLTTALASTAATNILAVLDNDPLLIQFKYQDSSVGFIQPGQYITLSYNLDGVTEVSSQTFIVNKIVYDCISGVGEIWASSELMYNYTILNYASRQLPMENSELIQQVNNQGVTCAGAWYLKTSGDTDDYFEFSVVSNVPRITTQGSSGFNLLSSASDYTAMYLFEDSSNYGGIRFNKSTNMLELYSTNDIYFYADDQTTYYMRMWYASAACTLYTNGEMSLRAVSTINIMPNNDTDDYLMIKTVNHNVFFNTYGGCSLILAPASNVTYSHNLHSNGSKAFDLGSTTYPWDDVNADDFHNRGPQFIESEGLYERFKSMEIVQHPTMKNSVGDPEVDVSKLITEIPNPDRYEKQYKRKFVNEVNNVLNKYRNKGIPIEDVKDFCENTYKTEEDTPDDLKHLWRKPPIDVQPDEHGASLNQWILVNTIVLKEAQNKIEQLENRINQLEVAK